MKKILSVIITALCVWILFLLNPQPEDKIAIIPVLLMVSAFAYFIILCILSEDDGLFD